MIEKCGILVHPEVECGKLNPQELLLANIWIYANTWGIYAEEIVIDIEEIVCFTFSLIIEVVSCPLQIPFGIGAITNYPTIRFGSSTFGDYDIRKNILICNTSSVDVHVSWHVFYYRDEYETGNLPPFNFICNVIEQCGEKLEFDITERFFGIEAVHCLEVSPRKLFLPRYGKATILVTFKPSAVRWDEEKINLRYFLLGHIFATEEYRIKPSYFFRKCSSIVIESTASLEKPHLNITVEADNNTLSLFANEVTLNRDAEFYIELKVRNSVSSLVEGQLSCTEPFSVQNIDKIVLKPGQCKKIKLPCVLSYDKIVKWASQIYNQLEDKGTHLQFIRDTESKRSVLEEVKLRPAPDKEIDNDKKIITFYRKLSIFYQGGFKDVIPVNIKIQYPSITVKPIHVKFGHLLVNRTRKTFVSVFNLTGYKVLFEVFKSTMGQQIVVIPSNGEIEKSTGLNHSFADIAIYFTPTECVNYQESIRIMTNIPQCYIDIPIKGVGSYNEKFDGGS